MTYMLRDIYFTEAACSYCINWVLFCWFFVCFVVVVFLFCFVCLFVCLFCHRHQAWHFEGVSMIPMLILFFFFFVLKQMRLWPLIPSVFTGISLLVPGIDILMIVMKREAEAGGIAILIVVFGQISTGFTLIIKLRAQSSGLSWVPHQRKAFPNQQKWK